MMEDAALELLARRCLCVGLKGQNVDEECVSLLRGVGGVVLFGRNVEGLGPREVAQLSASIKKASSAATDGAERCALVMVDQEGGRVARLKEPFTAVPSASVVGAAGEQGAMNAGRVLGRELKAAGIDVDLAPVVDVNTNTDSPVIGDRALSSSSAEVSRLAPQFIHAIQAEGVGACAKHFPGHGDTLLDSHHALPTLTHGLERLRQIELPPFKSATEAGVAAIMVAHVSTPALLKKGEEEESVPVPASVSPGAIGTLKEEIGFTGVVITDDMEMGAITKQMPVPEACVRAIMAGADMVMVCHTPSLAEQSIAAIVDAVREGRIAESRLREATERINAMYDKYGSPASPRPSRKVSIIGSRENRELIKSILATAAAASSQ